jgi:hypothetical protein
MLDNFTNIDDARTFEEIAQFRLQHYLISKANKFNFNDLLTGIYEDRTHFIYELIQNAEDTNAKEVRIQLFKDKIIFSHDGQKLFDLDDVKSITGIADSNKKPKDNKIGKFGIGFKAIFGICTSPQIYSGEFSFEINNLYVPKVITKKYEDKRTTFVIPFKEDIDHIETYNEIRESLENISSDKFLFLKNIQKIYWNFGNSEGYLERKLTDYSEFECNYSILSITKNNKVLEKYLAFIEKLSFNEKLENVILYRLNPRNDEIELQLNNTKTKLHVFFPTKVPINTKFLVHGPYKTTHTREQVLLSDQINKDIFKEALRLYKKSLLVVKKLGKFTLDFLINLPIEEPEYEWGYDSSGKFTKIYKPEVYWYRAFYDTTIKIMASEPLLITSTNDFCVPADALLARGNDLSNLVDRSQLQEVYKKPYNWLNSEITIDKTPRLRSYLMSELSIKEIDFDTFIRDCPNEFYINQSDEWLLSFYLLASNNTKTIKDKHLDKKFIRLENNQMVSPYTAKNPNAFLPSRVKSDKNIKSIFTQNNDVKLFFEGIGLTTMGVVEQIRDFIDILIESSSVDDYMINLEIIFQEYICAGDVDKNRIIEVLNSKQSILSNNFDNSKTVLAFPKDVYMPYDELYEMFSGVDNVWFLNKKIFDSFLSTGNANDGEYEQRMNFLKRLRINESLRIVSRDRGYSKKDKDKYLGDVLHTWLTEKSFQIEHIEEILSNMSVEKSRYIWQFLTKIESNILKGQITWHYGMRSGDIQLPSLFVLVLQNTPWIYNQEQIKVKPEDIYYEDAAFMYGDNQKIRESFRFKPNIIKTLPVEEQTILSITKGIPLDILESIVKQYQEQLKELTVFTPVDPNGIDAPIVTEIFTNSRIKIDESTIADNINDTENKDSIVKNIEEFLGFSLPNSQLKTVVKTISDKGEKIGKWGENFVFLKLESKYIQEGHKIVRINSNQFLAIKDQEEIIVTMQNFNDRVQKGYDITIEQNESIEYIEVKTREGSDKKSFNISGTQWQFAKSLELDGKGEKYYIYLVSNAGTKDTKITVYNNPYGNWLKGFLDAHPVAIKI